MKGDTLKRDPDKDGGIKERRIWEEFKSQKGMQKIGQDGRNILLWSNINLDLDGPRSK